MKALVSTKVVERGKGVFMLSLPLCDPQCRQQLSLVVSLQTLTRVLHYYLVQLEIRTQNVT